jgi:hypothetical protein
MENNMKTIFGLNAIVLAGLAFLSTTSGASAKNYQYCELDFSGMRDCRFETMEQCVAMISGRGGSCMRDPYLSEPRAAFASARKGRSHRPRL